MRVYRDKEHRWATQLAAADDRARRAEHAERAALDEVQRLRADVHRLHENVQTLKQGPCRGCRAGQVQDGLNNNGDASTPMLRPLPFVPAPRPLGRTDNDAVAVSTGGRRRTPTPAPCRRRQRRSCARRSTRSARRWPASSSRSRTRRARSRARSATGSGRRRRCRACPCAVTRPCPRSRRPDVGCCARPWRRPSPPCPCRCRRRWSQERARSCDPFAVRGDHSLTELITHWMGPVNGA